MRYLTKESRILLLIVTSVFACSFSFYATATNPTPSPTRDLEEDELMRIINRTTITIINRNTIPLREAVARSNIPSALFRGDRRPPWVVIEQGFLPYSLRSATPGQSTRSILSRGSNNLYDHVMSNQQANSHFISFTESRDIAHLWSRRKWRSNAPQNRSWHFVYEIQPPRDRTIGIVENLGKSLDREYAVFGPTSASLIRSVHIFSGQTNPNPWYRFRRHRDFERVRGERFITIPINDFACMANDPTSKDSLALLKKIEESLDLSNYLTPNCRPIDDYRARKDFDPDPPSLGGGGGNFGIQSF